MEHVPVVEVLEGHQSLHEDADDFVLVELVAVLDHELEQVSTRRVLKNYVGFSLFDEEVVAANDVRVVQSFMQLDFLHNIFQFFRMSDFHDFEGVNLVWVVFVVDALDSPETPNPDGGPPILRDEDQVLRRREPIHFCLSITLVG